MLSRKIGLWHCNADYFEGGVSSSIGARTLSKDWYFVAIVLISIIYFAVWILLQVQFYSRFSSGWWDLGAYAYTTYMHLGSAHYTNPLQYLVFGGHNLPFMILLLPVFAIYPGPMTLIAIQEMFLALTAVLIYLVTRNIAKNKGMGFAFAFAFLISPGLMGLVGSEFHYEAFIPFFYILSYYFYTKNRTGAFALSYAGLMCIAESTFVVGFSLLLALFAYGRIYKQNMDEAFKNGRNRLLLIGLALTVAAALFYYLGAWYISSTYSSISYDALPPPARLADLLSFQLTPLTNPGSITYDLAELYYFGGLGLFVILFQFGITSIFSPILSFVLYAPWLSEVFILHNGSFPLFYFQYYGFIIGGSYVAAMLGYRILADAKRAQRPFRLSDDALDGLVLRVTLILALYIGIGLFFLTSASYLVISDLVSIHTNYTSIENALLLIPANSSVMAQDVLTPHLYYVKNLETSPADAAVTFVNLSYSYSIFWFRPNYIVLDKNLSDYEQDFASSRFNVSDYMGKNYTTLYSSSGLYIFKRIATSQTQGGIV